MHSINTLALPALLAMAVGCVNVEYFPATTTKHPGVKVENVVVTPHGCSDASVIGYLYAQATNLPAAVKAIREKASAAGASGICDIKLRDGEQWAAILFGYFAAGSKGPFYVRATAYRGAAPSGVAAPEPSPTDESQ